MAITISCILQNAGQTCMRDTSKWPHVYARDHVTYVVRSSGQLTFDMVGRGAQGRPPGPQAALEASGPACPSYALPGRGNLAP